MKSLVGPGTVEAPPHHKIAFGGASVWPRFSWEGGLCGCGKTGLSPHGE